MALVAGLSSMTVLWIYLILGYAEKWCWQIAIYVAILAGMFQLVTLFLFLWMEDSICQQDRNTCEMGPGAYFCIFTSIVWFIMAYEMHYHTPITTYAQGYLEDHRPAVATTPATAAAAAAAGGGGNGGSGSSTNGRATGEDSFHHHHHHHHHLDYASLNGPHSLISTVEMTNVDEVAREYITRVTGPLGRDDTPKPGLRPEFKRNRPIGSPRAIVTTPRGKYVPPPPTF